MKRLFAYLTGAVALLIVGATAMSALIYAMLHRTETLQTLATSALSGIAMAIGGVLGSALVLRFKSAREFIKKLLNDINEKTEMETVESTRKAAQEGRGNIVDDIINYLKKKQS